MLTALSVGVLVAAAPAIGAFFSMLDARRGDGATSTTALAALPAALTAYAPGLVGFGLTALLVRALYVRGRPTDAGIAAGLGWSLAALLPLVVLAGGQAPGITLRWLGISSTLGMTVSGIALVVLVRRTWGTEVTRGAGRTAGALVVAVALAVACGDLVTHGRTMDTLLEAVLVGRRRRSRRAVRRGGRAVDRRPRHDVAGPPAWEVASAGREPGMRVLVVLGTSAGGVGNHVHGLVRSLTAAGHHVVVACPPEVDAHFALHEVATTVVPLELRPPAPGA